MTDVSIPELLFTTISLVFLLLGVVLIASIVMSTVNPNEQIAFANVEKLRAAMDQACSTGQDVRVNFELPQNTPVATGLFQVMPIWIIRTNGDPNYVLYYESFPPGEAVGWEMYQVMQNRLIVQLPDGWGNGDKSREDIDDYVKTIYTQWQNNNPGQKLEGVIVSNIELGSERFDYYFGESSGEGVDEGGGAGASSSWDSRYGSLNKYGAWQRTADGSTMPLDGDNYFKFNNYAGLNDFEKSAIKYMTCGAGYLCLKTRSGVYRLKLNQCSNVQAVQLAYNAISDTDVWKEAGIVAEADLGAIITIFSAKGLTVTGIAGGIFLMLDAGKEYVTRHIAFKISDFNVESPCELESPTGGDLGLTIRRSSCNQVNIDLPSHAEISPIGIPLLKYENPTYSVCENVMKYTLYRYNKDTEKLEYLDKIHYSCVESIGEGLQVLPNEAAGDYASGWCLQFIMTKAKNDYCWTSNPYKKSNTFWEWLATLDFVRDVFKMFFDPPIKSNTMYFESTDGKAIVLNPTDVALEKGKNFFDALGRKWWWGWP